MAFNQGKQGVVFANADIGACMEFGTALTNNDGARSDVLTAYPYPAKIWTPEVVAA